MSAEATRRLAHARRAFLAAVLSLGLVAAACGGEGSDETQPTEPAPVETPTETQPPEEAPGGGGRFEDAELGVAIDYPEGWTDAGVSDQPGVVVQLFAQESAGDGFAENVNLVHEELTTALPPGRYAEANRERLELAFGELQVVEEGEIRVGGAPAYSLEYEAEFQGQNLRLLQVFLTDGRRGFVLTYTGSGPDFDAYRADADAIIGSLRLT